MGRDRKGRGCWLVWSGLVWSDLWDFELDWAGQMVMDGIRLYSRPVYIWTWTLGWAVGIADCYIQTGTRCRRDHFFFCLGECGIEMSGWLG